MRAAESLAHFNADAIAAAQEHPTLTVGRFLYRGRLLSIEEWLPFWERLQAAESAPIARDGDAAVAMVRDRATLYEQFLRAVFPAHRYRFWAPDPVTHLLAQPFDVVEQAVAFFFILQARATLGATAIDRAMTTHGTQRPDAASRPVAAGA